MQSKVTIAIPTLNRSTFLRIALASAFAQSYNSLEVVVSNNASTDDTANLLASISDHRLRVLSQPNTISMMENWNMCLSAATGEYFLLLSDDDELAPRAIEEMVSVFQNDESSGDKIGFVYCSGSVIDGDGKTLSFGHEAPSEESAVEIISAFFKGKRSTWACAILFRREDLAPGYDMRFPLMADAAQWIRVAALYGSVRFVNRRLTRYRMHQNATLQTRIALWHKDVTAVSEFAIHELRRSGNAVADISQPIRESVRRMNSGLTADFINQSLRHDKVGAFKEYWEYRRMFMSPWGILVLVRGLLLLVLPNFVRIWLRR